MGLDSFIEHVCEQGRQHYRDLPWRNTDDPFTVLTSEVMLQQTQVSRLQKHWDGWLDLFPSAEALAAAPLSVVLEAWQGMGYNRRAINLKRCAETIVEDHGGKVPSDAEELLALPGVGPATAAGVRVFAFQMPDVYLETNVRTVFLHHFFPDEDEVDDKRLIPLVEQTCPQPGDERDVRSWYYALLDYGAQLKKELVNPSRRSKHYSRQSTFEGSRRQKRAYLLRRVLEGMGDVEEMTEDLNVHERKAGRDALSCEEVTDILEDLEREGFITCNGDVWTCEEPATER